MPAPRPGHALVPEKEIVARVAELGRAIARDYAATNLVLVGVLQGAIPFVADLMRAVALDLTVDFVRTSSYGSGMDEATAGLPPAAAAAAGDQVGAAHEIGAQLGGRAGATLIDSANSAFVDAMATTATLAAVAAVIGALIALALLPSRDRAERPARLGADGLEPAVA